MQSDREKVRPSHTDGPHCSVPGPNLDKQSGAAIAGDLPAF
jgi:hypothetical protein